ncbi:hypothetical protein ACROYT_G024010 [Oculina patagonica]
MEIGYNPDIFTTTLDQSFICPICQHVIREAVACKKGHLFCLTCINTWLDVHHRLTCPVGRLPLQSSHLRKIIVFDSLVESLEAFCQNREDGCSWTGSLENRNTHLQQCLKEPVPCTHAGCLQIVKREELAVHQASCDWRSLDCECCRIVIPAQEMQHHQRYVCRKSPVPCPFGCGDGNIIREDLNGHIEMECRRAFVNCEVPACTAKVRREDLEGHLVTNASLHVDLLMAERRSNNMNNVTPTLRPSPVQTVNWIIDDFENAVNANPEVGVRSPLISSMEIILVPTTSASGNMGVFVGHQGTNGPTCVNLSVALRNGRNVYLKRTPASRWLHPNTPMGWTDFLPLDEVLRRYIRDDGALVLQFSFQILK